MRRTLTLAAMALALAACEPEFTRGNTSTTTKNCTTASCIGCCRADDVCMPGNAAALCGAGGNLCADCSGQGGCTAEGACAAPAADGGPDDGGPSDSGPGDAGPSGNCAAPVAIAISGGTGTAAGSTTNATDTSQGSCGGAGGRDSVFQFTTVVAGTVNIVVLPVTSALRPVIYLRNFCDTPISERAGACIAAGGDGGAVQLTLPNLGAGTYYLWVDGMPGTYGAFNVNVSQTFTNGDMCGGGSGPLPLSIAADEGNAAGSTLGLSGDMISLCGGNGPDAVYTFTTFARRNLEATVVPTSSSLRPVVYLRSTCSGSGDELFCDAAGSTGESAQLRAGMLEPGTRYLWIDGADGTAGAYQLYVHLTAPLDGEACQNARALSFSGGGQGTAAESGDTREMFPDLQGSCGGGTSHDAIYTFTTTQVLNLRATLSTTTTGYQPLLYLRRATCTGSEVICTDAGAPGGSAALNVIDLQAGTYFLIVDGQYGTAGDFALAASLAPRPAGDLCSAALALTFSNGLAGGTATASGDTTALNGDHSGSCGGTTPAKDAVYSFTTNAVLNFSATITAGSSGFRPVLYLRNTSCTGTDRACGIIPQAGGSGTISAANVPVGTYFLFVDGWQDGMAGPYTLSASLTVPPPTGDTCASPLPLTFSSGAAGGSTSASGNTTGFNADDAASCSSTGKDVVYTFTTNTILNLAATVSTSTSSYQPTLFLRSGTSCPGTERACAAATAAGASANLSVQRLAAGTYFLYVDGALNTAGAFSLSATLTVPGAGESCTLPFPLVLSNGQDGGSAFVSGSTAGMVNDASATCGSATGPDLVYSFTTRTTLNLRAILTLPQGASFDSVLYLKSVGCSGATVGCADSGGSSSGEVLSIDALPADTYYLVVDGYNGASGPFNLNVTLTGVLAGDTCAAALPLGFSNGQDGGTVRVNGDTTGFLNQHANCSGGSGGDVVYSFTTRVPLVLNANIANAGASFQPVLYVSTGSCGGGETVPACNEAVGTGSPVAISPVALAAGTHHIYVDGGDSSPGTYQLNASLTAPAAGDNCASALPLSFSNGQDGGSAFVSGNTSSFTDETYGQCGGGGSAPDVVYTFTINRNLSLRANLLMTGSGNYGLLYLLSTCAGSQIGCAEAATAGGTASLDVAGLTPGTYKLYVDGSGTGDAGPFTLSATLSQPPAGDSCATALPLSFSGGSDSGTSFVTGSLNPMFNDVNGSCGADGQDAVYTFTTTTTRSFRATANPAGNFNSIALYLTSGCGGSELVCDDNSFGAGGAQISVGALPAGTYKLFVDAEVSFVNGAYNLAASLAAPIAGESCASAIPLVLSNGQDGGSATVTGSTAAFHHDTASSCDGSVANDLVYSFTLNTPQVLSASLSATSSFAQPMLYVRSGSCTSSVLRCDIESSGGTAMINSVRLDAGAHYLYVDSSNAGVLAPYTLTVATTPPGAGENCDTAIPLVFGNGSDGGTATASGDTRNFGGDLNGGCGGGSSTYNSPDVVYTFTIDRPMNFYASTDQGSFYDGVLHLWQGSCTGTAYACYDDPETLSSSTVSILASPIPAGTWYLVVDGYTSSGGSTNAGLYDLEVILTP